MKQVYEVAVENGTTMWLLNGKIHREDGPAVEYADGSKFWLLNGKLHREDGPAITYANGDKDWFLNGVRYTKVEFKKKMAPVKEMTVAEIEKLLGFTVKVVK